ncbi:DNA alkylation repair protein, partial [Candidatus Roizmanbacteria bacterium]|nr:DNA alkylation repair protein [Candidatus Roizmanbacteria bacterium]
MHLDLIREIQSQANPEKAKLLMRFFKTGKGQYGEGDRFLGLIVPVQRQIAKQFKTLPLKETEKVLQSPIHECRLTALFILIEQYPKATEEVKQEIIDLYLHNLRFVNNWDLVDLSAPRMLGNHLLTKDKSLLYKLAHSTNLWEKRVGVLSTFWFIKYKEYKDALAIAEILVYDKHDLIHKAVGWMLREIGKQDLVVEKQFLDKYFQTMPRTMLRYAIERFDPTSKAYY